MMWHWNSMWAPAPGDPPAVTDPTLWQGPWSVEQAIALQTRGWETMVNAANSWWSMVLSAWPAASGWSAASPWATPALDRAAIAGAEPLAFKPPALDESAGSAKAVEPAPAHEPTRRRPPARKRSSAGSAASRRR